MRLAALFLLSLATSCSAQTPSDPFYVTRIARSVPDDSTVARVVVKFDERTLIWLNGALADARDDLHEGGACLHIAKRMPPDGYAVDSVFAGTIDRTKLPTWHSIAFTCPASAAPIHFHIPTAALEPWLRAQGDTIAYRARCEVSTSGGEHDRGDVDPAFAHSPFEAIQCGVGIDSIVAYRVKARPLRSPRPADLSQRTP